MVSKTKLINILLVDDDEDDYLIIKNLIAKIHRTPFLLEWSPSYEQAEALITASRHDVYLIDYRLGRRDGLELLEAVQANKRIEPFIILTGVGDERIEQRAMQSGAADYLVKGAFDAELLARTLRYAVQRKRMEEQRVQHLITLNNAKDEFISLASHQLRTPATGVKQYIGMVLEGYTGDITEEQRAMLQTAYESNERQLQIVSDLLRIARVDAGKVKLRKQSVDLTKLLADILEEQRSKFTERQQEVVFRKPAASVQATIDAINLRMALENVIDNAGKYSPEHKAITVSLAAEPRGNAVVIQVHDEGVGISKADRGKLFQKFSRIDNPLSVAVGGSGLGLYWAKTIIDLHQGSIKVSSQKNRGSTFTIRLPVA